MSDKMNRSRGKDASRKMRKNIAEIQKYHRHWRKGREGKAVVEVGGLFEEEGEHEMDRSGY